MANFKLGRWLLVAPAIVGLAFAAPVVSAHGNDTAGNETTTADAPPYDGTAGGWAAWMEAHMTDHMGRGAVEWMESYTGVTVDEMAQDMADGDHDGGTYGHGQGHC